MSVRDRLELVDGLEVTVASDQGRAVVTTDAGDHHVSRVDRRSGREQFRVDLGRLSSGVDVKRPTSPTPMLFTEKDETLLFVRLVAGSAR